jgi:hypothetical protein
MIRTYQTPCSEFSAQPEKDMRVSFPMTANFSLGDFLVVSLASASSSERTKTDFDFCPPIRDMTSQNRFINVPGQQLPNDSREGDHLRVTLEEDNVISAQHDIDATEGAHHVSPRCWRVYGVGIICDFY